METFLKQLATQEPVWIGRGQCIEQYGTGEAYMPVLEALGRLCREAERERLIALLRQYAPTWLLQMPALLSEAERESLQRQVQGTTHERMLREMAEVIETITAERPLVLWLEDLHWSDYSTLELLAVLARRQEPARLLVLGTYRPEDVMGQEQPLQSVKQEMHLHGRCAELPLKFLSAAAVEEYLTRRLETSVVPQELVQLVHQRTEGNPLFMVNVVNELLGQGLITYRDGQWALSSEIGEIMVPAGLRQFIEQQTVRIRPEDREVLEAASVVGLEFSAATVAAGIEAEEQVVEKRCEALARRGQFLHTRGSAEWPDGTVSTRYGFIHALYQEVLYQQITAGRRMRLHGQIGAREEAGYGAQARQIAAELAVHFEHGRDYGRAVQYRRRAAENVLGRSAHQEAISHLSQGLKLLSTLPDSPDRTHQELRLQIMLGASLSATKGYTAPELERIYARAQELCQRVGETPQLVPVLLGLWAFYQVRGELHKARELGERRLHLAQTIGHPFLLLASHVTLGMTLFYQGEFVRAKAHWEKGAECYQLDQRPAPTFYSAEDPWVTCLAYFAWTLGLLGYPDQALQSSREALSSAQELSQPFSLALALDHASALHQLRREAGGVQERTEASVALAKDQGYPFWIAGGSVMRGWALSQQRRSEEGIAQIQAGLAALRAMGAELGRPYCLVLLAEAYEQAGQAAAGLRSIEEGLKTAHDTGERYYEAELYRLKGELILNDERGTRNDERRKKTTTLPSVHHSSFIIHRFAEAEECFKTALDIARRQQAKLFELRAVMSLSRLWQKQGKKAQARQMLAEILDWFTEGFDTADLKEAKALLYALS